MKVLAVLIKKDILLELRKKEALTSLLCLSILLCLIVSLGVNAAFLDGRTTQRLYMPFVWVISVFVATISLGRTQEYELENSAFEGVLLSGAAPWMMYLSKVVSNFLVVLLGHCLTVITLAAFLDVSLPSLMLLMLLSVLVLAGYSALGTLIAGISLGSRLRGVMLPLLFLPLVFPLFFAAVELGAALMDSGHLDPGSFWFSFLLGIDLIYVLLGAGLFEYVIRE